MNRTLLLIAMVFLAALGKAQHEDFNIVDKIAFRKSNNYLKKTAFVESAAYASTDFIYQRMEWEIDPNVKYISGKVTSVFKSNADGLTEIELDLYSTMVVDSVCRGDQKIDHTRKAHKIKIALPDTLNSGNTDSVSVYYHGAPVGSAFGAFSKTEHNGVSQIWTLSEPYGAMEWWPCKQSLADKIDSIDIIVTSPEPYRTASNGILVSETVTNGQRTMHWKHRHPIATYLVAIAVTNYVDYSEFVELEDGRKIEILNYVFPESEEDARSKTPVTTELMALFNRLIGEYPFADEKYGHAQFGWGGGMEHQTMSFMGGFSFGLISHELAHQWFGDYITLGSWHDIWLNEGFATYLAGLSYEHLRPDGWSDWKRINVDRITGEPGGSVYVTDTTSIGALFSGRLSYSKGAYLLHMLRWIAGDEKFFTAIRNYYTDPGIANGFARTNQLVKHFEAVCDTSFTEFFNDWFYGEGYPLYSARYWQKSDHELEITLDQTTSHPSVGFFEMPVPVRVFNADHSEYRDFRLDHKQNGQSFTVDPGFEVAEIRIDPDLWLVSKTKEIVGVSDHLQDDGMTVYPNPFDNVISVTVANGARIDRVKLSDQNGKLIDQRVGHQTTYPLPGLSKGMYILQVETGGKTFERKIVKQ